MYKIIYIQIALKHLKVVRLLPLLSPPHARLLRRPPRKPQRPQHPPITVRDALRLQVPPPITLRTFPPRTLGVANLRLLRPVPAIIAQSVAGGRQRGQSGRFRFSRLQAGRAAGGSPAQWNEGGECG